MVYFGHTHSLHVKSRTKYFVSYEWFEPLSKQLCNRKSRTQVQNNHHLLLSVQRWFHSTRRRLVEICMHLCHDTFSSLLHGLLLKVWYELAFLWACHESFGYSCPCLSITERNCHCTRRSKGSINWLAQLQIPLLRRQASSCFTILLWS